MLKSLFGHSHGDAPQAAGGSPRILEEGGLAPSAAAGGLLFSTDSKVELREVSGAMERVLSRGAMELRSHPGGGGAAAWLQVGSTELPLGAGGGSAGGGGGGGGEGGDGGGKQTPLFHRINARTFRLHLAGGPAQAAAVPGGGAAAGADGTARHDNSTDAGGAGSEAPSLLLLFPPTAPEHDLNTCAAVLADLAAGRGAAEPAGVAAYSPRGGSGPSSPAHGRGGSNTGAAGGPGAGGAAAPISSSFPASVSTSASDSRRVLFHDSDPARNLGFKGSHPVRLTHLEHVPPPTLRQQQQQQQQQLQQQLANQQRQPHPAQMSGSQQQRPHQLGGGGAAGRAGVGAGARSLLGPQGAEVGSPGGTRAGRLQGLALGSVWGSVAVANLAYEKDVRVRYSLDGWSSWGEVSANWDKRLGLGADNFNFLIDLDEAAASHGVCVRNTLAAGQHVTLGLAVHYLAAGQEHWDSNEGGNYTFDFALE